MSYNTRDPLSLILRNSKDLQCPSDGRVKWCTVSRHFNLDTQTSVELGFNEWDETLGVDYSNTYAQALNGAWATVVSDYRPYYT
jgi:hypothetical protein